MGLGGATAFALARAGANAVAPRRSARTRRQIKKTRLTVAFPRPGLTYGATSWLTGCAARPGLCGTVRLSGSPMSVVVAVRRNAGGRYWNGHAFNSRRPLYRRARLVMGKRHRRHTGLVRWFYPLSVPSPDGQYSVRVRARQRQHRVTRRIAQHVLGFAIDTVTPTPPAEAAAVAFSISEGVTGLLYPGGPAREIPLTLVNPGNAAIAVTDVTAAVQPASLPPSCGAQNFAISQARVPSTGLLVGAHTTVTLRAAGVAAPTIRMVETGTDQIACAKGRLALAYAGSAHS